MVFDTEYICVCVCIFVFSFFSYTYVYIYQPFRSGRIRRKDNF